MLFVVVDIAEDNEVVDGVPTFLYVVPHVVELEHFSRIFRRKHGSVPLTSYALETIPLKYCEPHRIRNSSVVLVGLPVLFKHIYADRQILASTVLRHDRPSLLGPQLANASRPLLLVFSQILQFLTSNPLANVPSEIINDFFCNRYFLSSYLIQYIPPICGLTILLFVHQHILVRFNVPWMHTDSGFQGSDLGIVVCCFRRLGNVLKRHP